MNTDGTNVIRVTDDPQWDTRPAWSPDGTQITFARWRNRIFDIYIIGVDGEGETNLTNSEFQDNYPTWSPDGQWIAYSSESNHRFGIYVMNADGRKKSIALIDDLEFAIDPDWSPSLLAVSSKGKMSTLWGILKREK